MSWLDAVAALTPSGVSVGNRDATSTPLVAGTGATHGIKGHFLDAHLGALSALHASTWGRTDVLRAKQAVRMVCAGATPWTASQEHLIRLVCAETCHALQASVSDGAPSASSNVAALSMVDALVTLQRALPVVVHDTSPLLSWIALDAVRTTTVTVELNQRKHDPQQPQQPMQQPPLRQQHHQEQRGEAQRALSLKQVDQPTKAVSLVAPMHATNSTSSKQSSPVIATTSKPEAPPKSGTSLNATRTFPPPPPVHPTASVPASTSMAPIRGSSSATTTTNASGSSGHSFMSAGKRLELDVQEGRVPPSILAKASAVPVIGLRRNPHSAPFAAPSSSAAEVGPSNDAGASLSTAKVLSNVVNPKASSGKATGAARQTKPGGGSTEGDDDDARDPSLYPSFLLQPDGSVPPILLPLDPKLVTQIAYEIVDKNCNVGWDDIAGLHHAKESVEEAIVWPLARPDIFTGLRDPPRGLLLFGPPGTGKTMIARAIASRANCTFLNISSSSLMSKWIGDGEKMVRCMFAVAVVLQPSVIFIDEIDSLLSMRGEGEQDAVRRVKTEFLVQLDGVGTSSSDRVLLIGATNRPEELDEAARRRMEKRLYIPLPDEPSRRELVSTLICKQNFTHHIGPAEVESIAKLTTGYSGADLKTLCREAAMGPLRAKKQVLSEVCVSDIPPVTVKDFVAALKRIKPSVAAKELKRYIDWNVQYGSFPTEDEEGEEAGHDDNNNGDTTAAA